jgi:glutamine amidotransferase
LIAVIDYDIGNLRSVEKAVRRTGYDCIITRDRGELLRCDKLILPGVGNFDQGMKNLRKYNLTDILSELVTVRKKPILGICLGMQLMTGFSEEGNCLGLGWINGRTQRLRLMRMKVPHIGWNTIEVEGNARNFIDPDPDDEFYFVHSYYVVCDESADVLCRTNYEISFISGFWKENIIGVQFHPEKSHDSGLKVLKEFLRM